MLKPTIKSLSRISSISLSLLLSAHTASVLAAVGRDFSAQDSVTKRAFALLDQNKADSAIELESQALKSAPDYWMPHAVISVIEWRRSQFQNALKEAKEAVRLAPELELPILNYAQMNQQLAYHEPAIPAFRKAIKLAPSDWTPRLGLMKSLVGSSNRAEALLVLEQMKKLDGNFEWWYQQANGFVALKKPNQAAEAAQKAVNAATTGEQKSEAYALLLNELIESNQLEKARAIEQTVFAAKPRSGAVYVNSLIALCDAKNPASGKTIIDIAIAVSLSDSSDYFKLGQSSESKAFTAGLDDSHRSQWLNNADSAYRAAIKAEPMNPAFYLALAGVLDQKGERGEMKAMLSKVKTLDGNNPLAPYLMARMEASNNDLAGRLRDSINGENTKPYHLNLARVDFEIQKLQCKCHLTALEFQLKQESGVKFVAITSRDAPIRGTLLVDQAYGAAQALATAAKVEKDLTIKTLSSTPVLSIGDAIRTSQGLTDVTQVSSSWNFNSEPPKMPVL